MKRKRIKKHMIKWLSVLLAFVMVLGTVAMADTSESTPVLDKQQQLEALLSIEPVSYSFDDLQYHWAKDSMMNLVYMGILKGIGNNTMKPEGQVTRAEFVAMMTRALDLTDNGAAIAGYNDISEQDWYFSDIMAAKANGMIDIFAQDRFYPDKPITREEMAVIASKAVTTQETTMAPVRFSDIPITYTYFNEINKVTSLGIIAGTPTGYFKPYDKATRAQAAVIIQRILSIKDENGDNGQVVADAALNYERALMDLDGRDEGKTLRVFGLSAGKEKLVNGYRISLLNDQNARGTSYFRSLSNEKAQVKDYGKYLSSVEVSYTATVLLNGAVMHSEDFKRVFYMSRNRSGWQVYNIVDPNAPVSTPPPTPATQKEALTLAWQYVGKTTPDMTGEQKINDLDIVSPTWFTLLDKTGKFKSSADIAYTNWAHKNGYKVWALVSNEFDTALSASMLNNRSARNAAVSNLISLAQKYKVDGLNIDFENMRVQDKTVFTAFVQELHDQAKTKGIIISVDVTVIVSYSNWSQCYDRKALAKVSDYIALMAYDQHWVGGDQAGSVAQQKWVEDHLKKVLKEVPANKLILGIPFYTILWKEKTVAGKSTPVVTSTALSMESAERVIAANKAKKVWDAVSGQYYVTFWKDGARYKMWLEDERSIKLKAALATKYKLAGTGAWKLGLERQGVWPVIAQALNK